MKTTVVAFSVQVLGALVILSSFGCDNRTVKPMCDEGSDGMIEGITGVYSLNMRNTDDFSVTSTSVRIVPDELKKTARVLNDDSEIIATVCVHGGFNVWETTGTDFKGAYPSRLFVTQAGLHIHPLMFDKTKLDEAGIPNTVEILPEEVRKVLGVKLSSRLASALAPVAKLFDDEIKELVVDNTDVPNAFLLRHATPGAVGFAAFRQ